MRRLRKATAAKNITSSDLVRDAVRRYVDGLLDADKEDNAQQRQRD